MNLNYSALVRQRVRNAAELCRHEHHLEELVEDQAQNLRHSNQAVVDALSSIIEFRSAESGRHVLRLRRLTQILLEDVAKSCPEYGLTERDIRGISSAASLHDIGKIAIPDAILNKNQPLSPQEFEVMKTHTLSGSRMLEKSGLYLVGGFSPQLKKVTLHDSIGPVHFFLLPYFLPQQVRLALSQEEPEQLRTVSACFAALLAHNAEQIDPTQRNVLLAHGFFICTDTPVPVCSGGETAVGTSDLCDLSPRRTL